VQVSLIKQILSHYCGTKEQGISHIVGVAEIKVRFLLLQQTLNKINTFPLYLFLSDVNDARI